MFWVANISKFFRWDDQGKNYMYWKCYFCRKRWSLADCLPFKPSVSPLACRKLHLCCCWKTRLMKWVQASPGWDKMKILHFLHFALQHFIRIISNLFHTKDMTFSKRFGMKNLKSEVSDFMKILQNWFFQLIFPENRSWSTFKHWPDARNLL